MHYDICTKRLSRTCHFIPSLPVITVLRQTASDTLLHRPKLYSTVLSLVITDSNFAASSVMATSAQHQNKVFFIVCFIRSLVFPTTATLLLLGATVYLVFYTFHQESLMGFVPPAMVGLLSLIFLPFLTFPVCF